LHDFIWEIRDKLQANYESLHIDRESNFIQILAQKKDTKIISKYIAILTCHIRQNSGIDIIIVVQDCIINMPVKKGVMKCI